MRLVLTIGFVLIMSLTQIASGARPSPKFWRGSARSAGVGGISAGEAEAVTSYPRMTAELQSEARRSPWVRLTALGRTPAGRTLWMARVTDPAEPPAAQTVRLLVLCRQHGDEPASTEAVLRLLRRLTDGGDPELRAALRRVTLYVIPMVNPDGAAAGTRANGAGADLNRDWGVFSQPETRVVARAVARLRPHIVVDAHNWDGGDHYNANCIEVTRDGRARQGQAAQALQAVGVSQLTSSGYAVAATSYGPEADPHLAHRWFTQRGILSCLIETHSGDPRDAADFQRRQGVYIALIHALTRRYADARGSLDTLEGYRRVSVQDARLFPPRPTARMEALPAHPVKPLVWLWSLCAYGLTLLAAGLCRPAAKITGDSGNARGPTPTFAPASGRPSAGRPGKRRCRCSPCSRAPRPAPAACGRKR